MLYVPLVVSTLDLISILSINTGTFESLEMFGA